DFSDRQIANDISAARRTTPAATLVDLAISGLYANQGDAADPLDGVGQLVGEAAALHRNLTDRPRSLRLFHQPLASAVHSHTKRETRPALTDLVTGRSALQCRSRRDAGSLRGLEKPLSSE